MHHPTDRIAHTTAFVSRGALAGTRRRQDGDEWCFCPLLIQILILNNMIYLFREMFYHLETRWRWEVFGLGVFVHLLEIERPGWQILLAKLLLYELGHRGRQHVEAQNLDENQSLETSQALPVEHNSSCSAVESVQKEGLPLNKEGRKEMFYLTTHSTHFIYTFYMASDMVKDHSDSEKGNPLLPHRLLFPINSKGSFICTIQQTG